MTSFTMFMNVFLTGSQLVTKFPKKARISNGPSNTAPIAENKKKIVNEDDLSSLLSLKKFFFQVKI